MTGLVWVTKEDIPSSFRIETAEEEGGVLTFWAYAETEEEARGMAQAWAITRPKGAAYIYGFVGACWQAPEERPRD